MVDVLLEGFCCGFGVAWWGIEAEAELEGNELYLALSGLAAWRESRKSIKAAFSAA